MGFALAASLLLGALGCTSAAPAARGPAEPAQSLAPPGDRVRDEHEAIAYATLMEDMLHPEWTAVHYGFTIRLTQDQRGWFVVVTLLDRGPGHDLRGYVIRRDGTARIVPVRSGECLIAGRGIVSGGSAARIRSNR